jgi:Zn-dependent protease
MFNDIDPQVALAQIIVLFFGIGLHEYAHCKLADLAGDPTPRYYGRVTLNLFKHFDPLGALFILFTVLAGFGIGWGKPSPMDPRKMRNPRWDWFIAIIAGPLSNVLQAVIYAMILRLTLRAGVFTLGNGRSEFLLTLLMFGVLTNLALAMFNMIPFGPLDGKWLLGLLMPDRQRIAWFQFNDRIGFIGLFAVILLLQFSHISLLSGPVLSAFQFLTGLHFGS